ncbi:homoserine O-acetyltransferase [Chytridium lagenaria]|nr:homoserine O-acetyltransferase [Chytridium lagenaria]
MSHLVNLVNNQKIAVLADFETESGIPLKDIPVAYKTWGTLNSDGSNCMVICHALSGSADVEDWWGPLLGPGRAFDPSVFFIFCGNVFGSPYGSFAPVTINPETGKPFGPEFPLMTIRDDVRAHKTILDTLGVKEVQYVIGGSMGGMQVMEWAFFGPNYVKHIVPIATSGRHSAWGISWGEAQRQSIYSDPNYIDGYYSDDKPPSQGLAAARMAALLTYRSRNSFETRFGRNAAPGKPIPRSTGQHGQHQQQAMFHNEGNKVRLHLEKGDTVNFLDSKEGDKFIKRFDANCYIALTRKMDCHDISLGRGSYEDALATIEQPTLVIGIETDGLFTLSEQYELSEQIPNSEIIIIHSFEGHDGFLLEFEQMNKHLTAFIRAKTPLLVGSSKTPSEPIEVKASTFGEAEGPDALLW